MIRRTALVGAALTLVGIAVPALVSSAEAVPSDGSHSLCVMGSDDPNSGQEGICVWVPTH